MKIKTEFCKVEGCGRLKDKSQGSSMCMMHRVRWSRYKSHDIPKKVLPDGILKICRRHGELKIDEVYLTKSGHHYQCRACKKDALRRYEERHPGRDSNLLKHYHYIGKSGFKILKEEYHRMYEEQGGVCKICKNPENTITNRKRGLKARQLAVDHCHWWASVGILKVRGLLCFRCNTMISYKKSIEELKSPFKEYVMASATSEYVHRKEA